MTGPLVLLLALLVSRLAAGPLAQTQQSGAVFKAKTTLLTLDVTVLDRDGRPVPGLRPEEFEVKINGTVQTVQALVYLDAGAGGVETAPPGPPSAPIGLFSRRTVENAAPPERGRVFVLVVDDLSFEPGAGKALFVSAESFVSRLPAADFVGYALTSGSRSINPTQNRRAILDALKTTVGVFTNPADLSDPPIVSIGEALEIAENGVESKAREVMLRECFDTRTGSAVSSLSTSTLRASSPCADAVSRRARRIMQQIRANRTRQLQSLEAILISLRHAPGIKHVVLLSNGVPMTREINDFVAVARTTAVAGVQVSTMVQEGDIDLSDSGSSVELPGGGSTPVRPGRAQSRREDDRMLLGGAQTLTDMAGGQFYRVIGQPHRFFDRVTDSASAVYRLGVSLPPGIKPGQDLAITAKVTRSGLSALASHYAEAPEPETTLAPEQRVSNAVTRGETLYGVPISFGAIVRRGASPGQIEIGAAVSVPGAVQGPLTTMFGLLDGAGTLKRSTRSVPAPSGGADYDIPFAIPVSQGAYQMRFGVADSRGNVGAVSMPIDATLNAIEGMETSDVLTWVRDAAGRMRLLVLDELPAGAGSLITMIELYPPTAVPPPDISVRFVLLDGTGQTTATKDANLTAGGGVLRADAQFDTSGLSSGLYGLRADIAVGGRLAGTATTSFRIPSG